MGDIWVLRHWDAVMFEVLGDGGWLGYWRLKEMGYRSGLGQMMGKRTAGNWG